MTTEEYLDYLRALPLAPEPVQRVSRHPHECPDCGSTDSRWRTHVWHGIVTATFRCSRCGAVWGHASTLDGQTVDPDTPVLRHSCRPVTAGEWIRALDTKHREQRAYVLCDECRTPLPV